MSDNDNISYTQGDASDIVPTVVQRTVTIPLEEYEELKERDAWLEALEQAGVDNWEGFDFAHEIYDTFNKA